MIDILMPRLSDTMTQGVVAAWLKQPGDTVSPGDVLVEIETDKALMEHEAYDAGTLAEILVPEGGSAPIGAPIARLDDGASVAAGAGADAMGDGARAGAGTGTGAPGDAAGGPVGGAGSVTGTGTGGSGGSGSGGTPGAAGASGPGPAAAEDHTEAGSPSGPPTTAPDLPERRAATPLVRRLARERDIDLATVAGTGPGGRIVRADIDALDTLAALAAPEAPGGQGAVDAVNALDAAAAPGTAKTPDGREPRPVPFDPIRRAIAARLTESGTTVPTFTATASADVGDLLALRGRINASRAEDGVKVSVNDLLVRAVALALRGHPGVNASYSPDGQGQTLLHGRVHVGVAVASPAGLVVPVVRDADRASVTAIAAATRDLVAKAAERRLAAADMGDGTFTVSNLGMYGVEHFTAIINPPQGAILAVGAAGDELALAGGEVVTRKRLRYTLTADHRVIDGALAAQFLKTLTELLENPLRIVA
ncbi:putative dihydrolipoamide acyltransferase component [Actinacidiphila reveromycinica]|uniref:Dihydrolipoamide acetyltransferase component of pyruvate dehydrogenase complex n=1 Tax=Actinacidiphila reveromycinica TaxID=659352 RepID=A0A7U3VMC3_9ACTN|nr:dihydrolipoamide acetyltransferase family protein [Streptomyces sp. SN-593]BBA96424.1 putative dihydrolipoamide acyltransferase component [Streptomyces sp. SN-593]